MSTPRRPPPLLIQQADSSVVDAFWLIFWSIFEPTLTIILGSIPVIRTFFRDLVRAYSMRRSSRRLETENLSSSDTQTAYTANNESGGRKLRGGHDKGEHISSEAGSGERVGDPSKVESQQHDDNV